MIKIKKADINDVEEIKKLIDDYANRNLMLHRSLSNLYENIRDFYVCRKKDKIIGCGALHIIWGNLAEIKSVAVNSRYRKKGIGGSIIKKCLKEAKKIGLERVFVLTYVPKFFEKQGFKKISRNKLPNKVWSECVNCYKFPKCDEIAMILDFEK